MSTTMYSPSVASLISTPTIFNVVCGCAGSSNGYAVQAGEPVHVSGFCRLRYRWSFWESAITIARWIVSSACADAKSSHITPDCPGKSLAIWALEMSVRIHPLRVPGDSWVR